MWSPVWHLKRWRGDNIVILWFVMNGTRNWKMIASVTRSRIHYLFSWLHTYDHQWWFATKIMTFRFRFIKQETAQIKHCLLSQLELFMLHVSHVWRGMTLWQHGTFLTDMTTRAIITMTSWYPDTRQFIKNIATTST